MIRWYDWVVAFVAAYLMLTFFIFALSVEIWYMSLIGSISVLVIWDIWKLYCEWRKEREAQK